METSLVTSNSCPILSAISLSLIALPPGCVAVHPSWLMPSPWPHITVFPFPFILDPAGQALLTWSKAIHFFFCVMVSTHVAVACTAPRPGVCPDALNIPWYLTSKAAENWSGLFTPRSWSTCLVISLHFRISASETSAVTSAALYAIFCIPDRLPTRSPTAANISCNSVGPMGISCKRSWSLALLVAALLPGPSNGISSYNFALPLRYPHDVHVSTALETTPHGSKSTKSHWRSLHTPFCWWSFTLSFYRSEQSWFFQKDITFLYIVPPTLLSLTHWGRVTNIYVVELGNHWFR